MDGFDDDVELGELAGLLEVGQQLLEFLHVGLANVTGGYLIIKLDVSNQHLAVSLLPSIVIDVKATDLILVSEDLQ